MAYQQRSNKQMWKEKEKKRENSFVASKKKFFIFFCWESINYVSAVSL